MRECGKKANKREREKWVTQREGGDHKKQRERERG